MLKLFRLVLLAAALLPLLVTLPASALQLADPYQYDPTDGGQSTSTQQMSTDQGNRPSSNDGYSEYGQGQSNGADRGVRGYAGQNSSGTANQRNTNPQQVTDSAGLDTQRNPNFLPRLPPLPPTSFQLLVERTLGQKLPLFGQDLFNDPRTFASLPDAPPTSDYIVSTGDQVLLRMWGTVNLNEALTVDRGGNIFVPQVGAIHVAGLSYSSLTEQVRLEVSRVFRNFNLSVNLGRLHSIQIFVTGEARRPGTYTVSSLSTLVNAIFASGGPSSAGSMRHIELRREGQVVTTLDLYDLLLHGDKSKDAHLLPGDVIAIAPAGLEVGVSGQVKQPAIYELKPGEMLATLIDFAGGPNSVASSAGVTLQQIAKHAYREARTVPLTSEGLRTPMSDGDLITLEGISNRFENTVTIRGNLANPGRFAWHTGMRVSEIIPEKASLLTKSYWDVRNAEGRQSPFLEPLPPSRTPARTNGSMNPSNLSNGVGTNNYGTGTGTMGSATSSGDDTRTSDREDPQSQYGNGAPLAPPVNANGDSVSGEAAAGAGTVLNVDPYTRNGSRTTPNAISPDNEQGGLSDRVSTSTAKITRVTLPAPEIDWSYAVIERTDRETLREKLLPFDLGKLVLDQDKTQDLDLQPGDVVTIFSQADFDVAQEQLTKIVRIEGEVVNAGVYSVQPGENLQTLVSRAGGLTSQAYLFGAQFTRESTRSLQQQRLEEYIDKLSVDMDRSTANEALSLVGTTSDTTVLTVEQRLISQLRRQRATGRIILDFKTDSQGVASIPPLSLENGDVLVIPSKPAVVSVIGSVPNQGSFLFRPGMSVRYYLNLAGRPDRDSDPKHAFVIRASGAVLSRQGNGFWGDTFEGLRLAPGDTLVIPAKLFKVSPLRTLIESSTAFSSLALVAATVAVNH